MVQLQGFKLIKVRIQNFYFGRQTYITPDKMSRNFLPVDDFHIISRYSTWKIITIIG